MTDPHTDYVENLDWRDERGDGWLLLVTPVALFSEFMRLHTNSNPWGPGLLMGHFCSEFVHLLPHPKQTSERRYKSVAKDGQVLYVRPVTFYRFEVSRVYKQHELTRHAS